MAPSSKMSKACKYCKEMGIPEETVKPVLKHLLVLFDNKWKHIEDDNYRVLVDAIFDHELPETEETRKQDSGSDNEFEECEPLLKRTRLRSQKDQSSGSPAPFQFVQSKKRLDKWGDTHLNAYEELQDITVVDLSDDEFVPIADDLPVANDLPQFEVPLAVIHPVFTSQEDDLEEYEPQLKRTRLRGQTGHSSGSPANCSPVLGDKSSETVTFSSPDRFSNNIKADSEHLSPPTLEINEIGVPVPLQFFWRKKRLDNRRDTHLISYQEPKALPVVDPSNEVLVPVVDDPTVDLPQFEVPLAVIHPDGSSDNSCSDLKRKGLELLEYDEMDTQDFRHVASDSSQIDIASFPEGDMKISLIFNSSRQSNFRTPNLDAVLRLVEERYLDTYRITEPGFSLIKLMKDVCESFLAEGTKCADDGQVGPMNLSPSVAISKNFNAEYVLYGESDRGTFCIQPSSCDGPFRFRNLIQVFPQIPRTPTSNSLNFLNCPIQLNVNGTSNGGRDDKTKAPESSGSSNSSALVVFQNPVSFHGPLRAPLFVDDITRGTENVKISLVNEISDEFLPAFYYIPRNITYQNGSVKFLLAGISDKDCCSNCEEDCLSLAIPCACAGETGGEFAYTPAGLVKENLLEKCISMKHDTEQRQLFYCNDCPLERPKDERLSGPCKGHLVRGFIKECWYKCGCSMKCGNRMVQQGVTRNLQVFMTPEGKGWGLRTLEDIPKGAFICEYVGEIVTNTEFFERSTQTKREMHTYPVLLDADWSSKSILKDEEALCLDATMYGNVARFINHRCSDANLVEIPVEVETPDHHYYHLALFTTRKVDALEELTWDYGIDFQDQSYPGNTFNCQCGSKFCRHKKRAKRT